MERIYSGSPFIFSLVVLVSSHFALIFIFKTLQVEDFFFLLGAVTLLVPTRISALQIGLFDMNSREGILNIQHSKTRVVVGKWRWLWQFMNTISVDLKLIKCKYEINEIEVNGLVS